MTELGKITIRLEEVDSTNELAKEYIADSLGEGAVIVAEVQTQGKGRLDRVWESPKGGLWLSIILKPGETVIGDKMGVIPLMTGSAVAHAISTFAEIEARVKWPNDVVINGRKVCGILSQSIVHDDERWVVVGIGVNVNNKVREGYEFSPVSTSLTEELGEELDVDSLMKIVVCELEHFYNLLKEDKSDEVLEDWLGLSDTIGKKVKITTPTEEIVGVARGIDENGALILELENGDSQIVNVGDCRHLE